MNTQNEPKYHHAHNYPFSQDTLIQAINDLGNQLDEVKRQLLASNEKNECLSTNLKVIETKATMNLETTLYWQERHRLMHEEYKEEFRINSELNKKLIDANEKNKRSVTQISLLEDKLKISQENTLYWQECSRSMQEKRKELTAYYEAAESDNERLVDALVVEQDKNKTLENKITELSTKDIKNQPEVKQGVNLTQSEVDFLKKYLSNCITESQGYVDLLKDTAKAYKGTVKNTFYKGADKLQKKLKVLSGIQHKLKKTVLNRKEPKDEFLGANLLGYKKTWHSIVDALEAASPNFFQHEGTGEQCAVRAILELGKDSRQLKELKELLNKA